MRKTNQQHVNGGLAAMEPKEDAMSKRMPREMDLTAGTYYWCACGRTGKEPFCDGAHRGTNATPVEFTLAESKKVWLCTCRKTGNAPFCDGAHAKQ
jgi:CDGSH-type Zn-finger protein